MIGAVGSGTKSGSRLTPNIADALRIGRLTFQKGQLPGLGPNELKNHVKAVWEINNRVGELTKTVEQALKNYFQKSSS